MEKSIVIEDPVVDPFVCCALAVEGGDGVLLGLNSGVLQDREWKVYNEEGKITAAHTVRKLNAGYGGNMIYTGNIT